MFDNNGFSALRQYKRQTYITTINPSKKKKNRKKKSLLQSRFKTALLCTARWFYLAPFFSLREKKNHEK